MPATLAASSSSELVPVNKPSDKKMIQNVN